jgi:hypothetical protein
VLEQPKQEVLRADVVVLELAGLGLGGIEHFLEIRAEKHIAGTDALDFVTASQLTIEIRLELRAGHAEFFQQIRDEAVALADHGQQQVFAIHFLMRVTASDPLRLLQRLLRFGRKPLELHTLRSKI